MTYTLGLLKEQMEYDDARKRAQELIDKADAIMDEMEKTCDFLEKCLADRKFDDVING